MKCGEPNPGRSWADCDRDLKHAGDHKYLNDSWPRLVPNDPNPDVKSLLEDAIPATAYGINERRYPIVVTETTVRVIWVDAEDEDQALAYWGDDPTDLPSDGAVVDGSIEIERPDNWQRQAAFTGNRFESKIGPLVPCPDCQTESFRREWFHNPMRKCHGPITWRESKSASPRSRYQRQHHQTPVYDPARRAVTA